MTGRKEDRKEPARSLWGTPGIPEVVNEPLQIRESIKALFPNRTCFPLVRPMSNESQLQRLEAVPPSQLRPEFQQVPVFCNFTLSFPITPYSIANMSVT